MEAIEGVLKELQQDISAKLVKQTEILTEILWVL